MKPRVRLAYYATIEWAVYAARLVLWGAMTGSLSMSAAWYCRPDVLRSWLASGAPPRRPPRPRAGMIKLEAARGVAALEYWLASPNTQGPGPARPEN